MIQKRTLILLAVALLGLAGGAAALTPTESAGAAVEPAVLEAVVLEAVVPEAVVLEEPAAAPLCTDDAEATVTAVEAVEMAVVEAGIDYGLCSMSCTVCYGNYNCPYGEWCMAVHHCPR